MKKIIALGFITMFALTACSPSEEVQPEKTEAVQPPQPEPKVQVNPEPADWQPSADVYFAIDEACGTSLGDRAEITGEGPESTVNALFIGMKSADEGKLECVLQETKSTMTWADLEAGIDVSSPKIWTSDTGTWAGAGAISPLGDDAMLTVNFFYLESGS